MSLINRPFALVLGMLGAAASALAQSHPAEQIAPDVYFREGDHSRGHCNNGWIVFDDYVLVIDANYPAGARETLAAIRAITAKPIRFVIDTHFHPDHSFGNQVWSDEGAVIVAQVGAFAELVKNGAAAWALEAKSRPDVAASALRLPSLLYSDTLVFDDGRHRVELHWPGVAHTHGDSLVWLPREKILFTGDLCVNGPYNYVHDSDILSWIKVLGTARALGAAQVCPGHGPRGGPEVIAGQQGYFQALQLQVQALIDAKKSPAEVKAAIPAVAAAIRALGPAGRFVPSDPWFDAHVEKVYQELGGQPFPP